MQMRLIYVDNAVLLYNSSKSNIRRPKKYIILILFHSFHLLLAALSRVIGAENVIHAAGYEGGEATFFCPYAKGYESYEKYLCNSKCSNGDNVLIETGKAQTGRYSIYDDKKKQVFTVTIADLHDTDAGTYRCGVSRTGIDPYTIAKLDVLPGKKDIK